MSDPKSTRKARFLAALRIAGMTMTEWAEQEGVTQGHVSNVLAGRESKSLDEKIAAFTEKHLRNVAMT